MEGSAILTGLFCFLVVAIEKTRMSDDSDLETWAHGCGCESDKCLTIRCLGFSQPELPLFIMVASFSLLMPRLGGKGHYRVLNSTSMKLIIKKIRT